MWLKNVLTEIDYVNNGRIYVSFYDEQSETHLGEIEYSAILDEHGSVEIYVNSIDNLLEDLPEEQKDALIKKGIRVVKAYMESMEEVVADFDDFDF